ncbi:uncharacterized protein LOC127103987 [Lathyrus oleraceus]|uniref:uncharacterized protein LOC127103987 n=1 Tax=Pisum sativum TaxID=3888 RepID=UPI0021D14EB5|nr:uncharacterized protein LOC127103987 [Pisum sativum]
MKEGNMIVVEYAAKFEALVKFYPHYICVDAETSKCLKIYNKDNISRSAHYKSLNEKKGKGKFRGKPYVTPTEKGKHKALDGKKTSGRGAPASFKCFKCGELGHHANKCNNKVLRCYNYGKMGHHVAECKNDGPTWYNYGEQGHISIQCQKPNKTTATNGRVFTLSGSDVPKRNNLIRGTCFINNLELISIIDTGATHSFISLDCATRLDLKLSSMVGSLVIDTSTNGSMTTVLVCLSCPLTIYGKNFAMDLACLPLHQITIILGIIWLELYYFHINCYSKTVRFPEFGDYGELMFLSRMFAMFASLQVDNKSASVDLPVMCNFPDVFPNDISDFPLEREIEFSIDVVPGTNHVSMASYRMPT